MPRHDGLWKYQLTTASEATLRTEWVHHQEMIDTIKHLSPTIDGPSRHKMQDLLTLFESQLGALTEEMNRRGLTAHAASGEAAAR